ncbi:hypothetical protein V6N11_059559 [Hibiscus sabdariffa]|uniref:RNase H type-1 domain-containing protein n=1 Tax=Hibiscus sabdariffa TaxID=183260 RepID=A0ABR2NP32_9ROSI
MWITSHKHHLMNIERVRRYIASSDEFGMCHTGLEDIDNVLQFFVKACELWGCVLGQEVVNTFDTLPFKDWLHGNNTGRLVAAVGRKNWGVKFSIFCWLLWKLRCSMVLDGDFVERESVLNQGNCLMLECKAVFSASGLVPAATSHLEQRWEGPQSGWIKGNVDAMRSGQVRICHVCRSRNGVVDKLVSLGRHSMRYGRIFAVPPGPMAVLFAMEHQC